MDILPDNYQYGEDDNEEELNNTSTEYNPGELNILSRLNATNLNRNLNSQDVINYNNLKVKILNTENSKWVELATSLNIPTWFINYILSDQLLYWRELLVTTHIINENITWEMIYAFSKEATARINTDVINAYSIEMYKTFKPHPLLESSPSYIEPVMVEIPPQYTKFVGFKQLNIGRVASWYLSILCADVKSNLAGAVGFRKLLSFPEPPINICSHSTLIVNKFVQFLKSPSEPIQFEASWTLTNLLSGTSDETNRVLVSGVLPTVSSLLTHLMTLPPCDSDDESTRILESARGKRSERLLEQLIWLLGNVAGDSVRCRDTVLLQCDNVLNLVCKVIESPMCLTTMRRNATWTLSNFCRGKPAPNFNLVKDSIPTFIKVLNSHDEEAIIDACWGLSYLSDGSNERIETILHHGVCPILVNLLNHRNSLVRTPALRTLGNIATGDDAQTSVLVNCAGFYNSALRLLSDPKVGVRKETCWTLSNIAAGNRVQISGLIESGCIPKLVQILTTDQLSVQKEAVWTFVNITSGGSDEHLFELLKYRIVSKLVGLYETLTEDIRKIITEGLVNLSNNYDNFTRLYAILLNANSPSVESVNLEIKFLRSSEIRRRLSAFREASYPLTNNLFGQNLSGEGEGEYNDDEEVISLANELGELGEIGEGEGGED